MAQVLGQNRTGRKGGDGFGGGGALLKLASINSMVFYIFLFFLGGFLFFLGGGEGHG